MIGATMLFAASYALTKMALRDVPPFTLGTIRFALAGLLLLALHQGGPRPREREARSIVVAAALGITAYFALENVGVQLATATDASLLVAAYPALTAIVETGVTRRRPSSTVLAGMAITAAGVVLVIHGSTSDRLVGQHRLLGDLFLVGSGLAWAGYTLVSQRRATARPVLQTVAWQDSAGAAMFLPLALTEAGSWRAPQHPAATTVCVVVLVLGCSIAAMALYNHALTGMSPTTAVNALNLVPLWGVTIATTLLHEALQPLHLAGAVLVITGVAVTHHTHTNHPDTLDNRSEGATQP